MKFLQIGVYDDDIPVLSYIEEQWEADRKSISYAVLRVPREPVLVVCLQLTANKQTWGRK